MLCATSRNGSGHQPQLAMSVLSGILAPLLGFARQIVGAVAPTGAHAIKLIPHNGHNMTGDLSGNSFLIDGLDIRRSGKPLWDGNVITARDVLALRRH